MKNKTIMPLVVAVLVLTLSVGLVIADGLSIQLKRTNPGIVGEKSAEIIFDIVNMNNEYGYRNKYCNQRN